MGLIRTKRCRRDNCGGNIVYSWNRYERTHEGNCLLCARPEFPVVPLKLSLAELKKDKLADAYLNHKAGVS